MKIDILRFVYGSNTVQNINIESLKVLLIHIQNILPSRRARIVYTTMDN